MTCAVQRDLVTAGDYMIGYLIGGQVPFARLVGDIRAVQIECALQVVFVYGLGETDVLAASVVIAERYSFLKSSGITQKSVFHGRSPMPSAFGGKFFLS